MILMGDLPFRIAFEDSTHRSCKCQLFLLCDDARILFRRRQHKIICRAVKTL